MVGGSNPGRPTLCGGGGGGGGIFTGPGFEPPTKKSVASCITIRPLLDYQDKGVPTAWGRVCHSQKTQTVCFCLTDCWPGSGTAWLTVNLSLRCTAEGNRTFKFFFFLVF